MQNSKKTALILLSGGLDSLVSIKKSNYKIELGLIFDYGQVAFNEEKKAAKKIAKYYGFDIQTIRLDWLKKILDNGLNNPDKIFLINDMKNKKEMQNSMKSVWVPNRNSLFLNIAASICEAKNIDAIIIGANKEEAKTFKDNSKEFILQANKLFKLSTNTNIEVIAPLADMDKTEIINYAIKNNIPLKYLYSCYKGNKKHCGECESCKHLKRALEKIGEKDLIKNLF